jgi:multiple sugar transport system permease protein
MTAQNNFSIRNTVVLIALVILSILFLLPLVWLVRSSFMDNTSIFLYPPRWVPNPVEWSNYNYVFSDYPLFRYLGNTLTIVVPTVLGVVVSSTLVAYGFSRIPWRGREVVFGVLLSTLMLPYVVTLIPTFFMWSKLGFVDTYVPLVLPSWFGGGIFNIFLLRQFFRTLPQDYDEAATLDGANHFQILWHIIVPLSRPALITIAILSFLYHWNDFLGPLIYLSTPEKFTLALGLSHFQGEYSAEWGRLMAASTVMLIPVIALFFFAQRYFIKGIVMSGLKG